LSGSLGDLCHKRVPNVLVTWNKPDGRGYCEVVKNLDTLFVARATFAKRYIGKGAFKIVAENVVIVRNTEAILASAVYKTVCN
jgi:hypothetical protein